MKVALAIETDGPGGAESMLLELARELRSTGHDVIAVGPLKGEGWLSSRFAELGIEREAVDLGRSLDGTSIRRLNSIVRKRRLDVLHSHEFTMAVVGAGAARLGGCRHVITMHGGSYFAERLRRRMALRVAVSLSARTVAVSNSVKHALLKALHLADESVIVVHNGATPLEGQGLRIRRDLQLSEGDLLILAVGNLYPVKGHAILLEALVLLANRGKPRVVAVVAGRGEERDRLAARSAELGMQDRFHLLGFRSDVPDLLHAADVIVMPSLSEGLPMAIIEAMLAGKMIVATDVGGIPELISNDSLGLLVPAGDAVSLAEQLQRAIDSPSLRNELGKAARARALKEFSASAMAQKYASIYER